MVIVLTAALVSHFGLQLADIYEEQEVSKAVAQARTIANAVNRIWLAKSGTTGELDKGRRSFREFYNDLDKEEEKTYFANLDLDKDILGESLGQLYYVQVTDYSVQVSFNRADEKYRYIRFPATARTVDADSDGNFTGVTYTVLPETARGLHIAHHIHQYINEDDQEKP